MGRRASQATPAPLAKQKTKQPAWPNRKSDPVPGQWISWKKIDSALRRGGFGLPGEDSLAKLLRRKRGGGPRDAPTKEQILDWADRHYAAEGSWPGAHIKSKLDDQGLNWWSIDYDLKKGRVPGVPDMSLGEFLKAERSVPHVMRRRDKRRRRRIRAMTVPELLAKADKFRKRHGRWPNSADEPWAIIDSRLRGGSHRGFSSLGDLLHKERGIRPRGSLLTPEGIEEAIRSWTAAKGRRPVIKSGRVTVLGHSTTWARINTALNKGLRGLAGGDTLTKATERALGTRNPKDVKNAPKLTESQVIGWIQAWRKEKGSWPMRGSGRIPGAGGETWSRVDSCLNYGGRGLPGGTTLRKLCEQKLGKPKGSRKTHITENLKNWINEWTSRTGRPPSEKTKGKIPGAGISWKTVDNRLREDGSSLAQKKAEMGIQTGLR